MKIVPQHVTAVDHAFGAAGTIDNLLPAWGSIPARYRNRCDTVAMTRLVSRWFFRGLPGAVFHPRPGIDRSGALCHLAAILNSFAPKHEHKEAGCAYLCALWFERVVVGADVYESDIAPGQEDGA